MAGADSKSRVADYLEAAARDFPDRPGLICDDRRLSFREYEEKVSGYARGLLALSLEPGDRIALMMDNCLEHPVVLLAAEKIGVTSVLVNNRLQADEVDYVLGNSEPALVVVGERFVAGDAGAALKEKLDSRFGPGEVLVVGEPPEGDAYAPASVLEKEAAGVSAETLDEVAASVGEETPVVVIYTSGTTGRPKGAVITERNIVSNLTAWRTRLPDRGAEGVVGVFFPLFHSAGAIGGICGAIVNGFTVVLADFDIERSLRLISEHGITFMGGVAAMAALQMSHPAFDRYDYSSLKYIIMGAGPCPPEIRSEVKRRMGAEVIIGYGLTEATMGNVTTTLLDDTDEHKLETIGVPLPGTEVRLVDAERDEVPDGQVGEIAIKGPTVFAGYLNDLEATRAAKDEEGWLYTGDLALRCADGYYRIAGRLSEMYIRGGENVYPGEVEEVLARHPDIVLAAVLGVPDEVMGESGRAYIIKAPGSELTEEDVKAHVAGNLAGYKVPGEVVFRDVLPLTPIGKVLKKELKAKICEEFGLPGA